MEPRFNARRVPDGEYVCAWHDCRAGTPWLVTINGEVGETSLCDRHRDEAYRLGRIVANEGARQVCPGTSNRDCPRCDYGTLVEQPTSDTYRCNYCGWTIVSVLVRAGAIPGRPLPPAPEPPKCWKCDRALDDPARISCIVTDDSREHKTCLPCSTQWRRWVKEQDRLAREARVDLDRPVARRKVDHLTPVLMSGDVIGNPWSRR